MEISLLTDCYYNQIYEVNTKNILVNRDIGKWEIWEKYRDSWRFKKAVMRKEYKEYIKNSLLLKEKELVEFELYDEIKVYLLTQEEVAAKKKKLEAQEAKEKRVREEEESRVRQERQEREELSSLAYKVRRELEKLKIETMTSEEVKQYKAYMQNILENLKRGEIKDTKTTRKLKKNSRLELYKNEIDKYLKKGKYTSINKLCKDLKINRATFYNLKLNEYIESKEL